jgi:biotin carboxyl carrier protein
MPGKVIKVNVSAGQKVTKGEVLVVVESMKMENALAALANGVVKSVTVKAGQMVDTDKVMVELELSDE